MSCLPRLIFLSQLSLINYTVDAYLFAAASALAASTVSRSIFGAVFPVRLYPTLSRSAVFNPYAALCTTNVRLFKSSVGINSSRVCCRHHDSYPYCPSALWSLFALEIEVYTEYPAHQTRKFHCISSGVDSRTFDSPSHRTSCQWTNTIN